MEHARIAGKRKTKHKKTLQMKAGFFNLFRAGKPLIQDERFGHQEMAISSAIFRSLIRIHPPSSTSTRSPV